MTTPLGPLPTIPISLVPSEGEQAPGQATDEGRGRTEGRPRSFPAELRVALVLGVGLALAHVLDVSASGKLVALLGVGLAIGAAHSAFFNPRCFPIWLVVYLPYNSNFPFTLGGASSLNLTSLLWVLSLVSLLSSHARRSQRLPWSFFDLLLFAFIGFGVLGLGQTLVQPRDQDFLSTVFAFKRWLTPFFLYFVVRAVLESRDDLRNTLVAVLWTTVLIGALVWADGRDLGDPGSIDKSRVGSVLGQANSMGAFLVYYGVPLLAFSLKAKRKGVRLLGLAGFLTVVRALLFTLSRGAYLSLAAASGLILLLGNPLLFSVAGGAAAATQLTPELIPSSVRARVGHTQQEEIYDGSLESNLDHSSSHRLMLWRAGLNIIRAHPLQGIGWHRFADVVEDYSDEPLAEGYPRDAHNAYVLTGAELGLPALAVMILLLAGIAVTGGILYFRQKEPFDRALALSLLGSVVGVVISCMFGSRFADEALATNFWILVALLMASRHLQADGSLFGAPA